MCLMVGSHTCTCLFLCVLFPMFNYEGKNILKGSSFLFHTLNIPKPNNREDFA